MKYKKADAKDRNLPDRKVKMKLNEEALMPNNKSVLHHETPEKVMYNVVSCLRLPVSSTQ